MSDSAVTDLGIPVPLSWGPIILWCDRRTGGDKNKELKFDFLRQPSKGTIHCLNNRVASRSIHPVEMGPVQQDIFIGEDNT